MAHTAPYNHDGFACPFKRTVVIRVKAYPRTRVVIDCTEFYVQKPFRPLAQRTMWSHYKHANTFKLLVGIMPLGAFTFLSDLYSGSISDIDIVKKSGFMDIIEEGDDVMADSGFNIRHHLLPRKATLDIPAFTHGKQLSKKAGSHIIITVIGCLPYQCVCARRITPSNEYLIVHAVHMVNNTMLSLSVTDTTGYCNLYSV